MTAFRNSHLHPQAAAFAPLAGVTFSVIDSVLPPQFQDMLYVRFVRDRKTGSLQTADTEVNTIN